MSLELLKNHSAMTLAASHYWEAPSNVLAAFVSRYMGWYSIPLPIILDWRMVPVLSSSIRLTTRWLEWLAGITPWSWCWPVSFGHTLGQQEGKVLRYSKGFRLAGRTLTSLHMRLLLMISLVHELLFFELRWHIFVSPGRVTTKSRLETTPQSLHDFFWAVPANILRTYNFKAGNLISKKFSDQIWVTKQSSWMVQRYLYSLRQVRSAATINTLSVRYLRNR